MTAGDYAEMLWEDKRRKKEIEEQKQKRKEVREQKKKEKEARIEAGWGRGRERGRGHGRGKGKKKAAVVQSSESESDALSDVDMLIPRHTHTSSAGETSHKRGIGVGKASKKQQLFRVLSLRSLMHCLMSPMHCLMLTCLHLGIVSLHQMLVKRVTHDVSGKSLHAFVATVKVRRMMEQFVFSVSIMTQKGYQEA